MARPKIVRVWGKADTFDLEFSHKGGTSWICSVPPDTVDGQYAVEVWAINEFGQTAHWTGELYMCNGVCHIELYSRPYQIWLNPVYQRIHFNKPYVVFLNDCSPSYIVAFDNVTEMIIRKGCTHHEQ